MNRILMIGQFHTKNIGDQAIFRMFKSILSKKGNFDVEEFPIKSPEHTFLSEQQSLKWILISIWAIFIGLPRHYFRLYTKCKDTDLVIIGGGNLIMDHTLFSSFQFLGTVLIVKLAKKKLFIGAVGAGPIKYKISRFVYKQALRLADKITVRDKYSYNVLMGLYGIGNNNLDITVTADPVFTTPLQCKMISRENPVIGISTAAFESPYFGLGGDKKKYESYIQRMTEIVIELVRKGYKKIYLIPTEAPYDVKTMNDIAKNTKIEEELVLTQPQNFNDLIDVLCDCDLIIGTRMHSMIIALSQYIPIIGISNQGKTKSLFEAIGFPSFVFNIESLNIKNILDVVSQVILERNKITTKIRERVLLLQSKAEQNGDIAVELTGFGKN